MQKNGAEVVLACLKEQGVTKIFGYPGGAILPFYDALLKYPDIEHILTVHEQGAVHAADGYARASGKVGVCVATSGPGATNLVTGIANAFLDSIPLVVITGQVATPLIGGDVFQEVDITGITMPITKHNFLVKKPNQLADIMRLAFKIAKSGRPGPVLVDIPRDVQTAAIDYQAQQPLPIVNEAPDRAALQKAVQLISNAKRPVILVGGGAVNANVHTQIMQLVAATEIPFTCSLMGLSAVCGSDSRFLGMSGLHGHEAANKAIAAADVLLAVGCRFNDRITGDKEKYAQDKTVIQLDIDHAEIDKNISAGLGIVGDMQIALQYLCENISYKPPTIWWDCISNWQREAHEHIHSTQAYFMQLSDEIRGQDVIVCTDVGQHQMWAAQNITVDRSRGFITSGGLGTMGFGIPAAMGAAFAVPEATVVCISGDGGFKMTSQDFYTIARYQLPIISVVINNQGLGMIRQLQKVIFDNRYSQCELPGKFDFVKYAQVFGLEGYRVTTHDAFRAIFAQALQAKKPCIIEVAVEHWNMVIPMVKPGKALNEFVKF